MVIEVLGDSESAHGVDAREVEEGATSVRARKPTKIPVVDWLTAVRRRAELLAGLVVHEVDAVVIAAEAQLRIRREHLPDERQSPRFADHNQIGAVEVDHAPDDHHPNPYR
ncbi:hypothetical protein AB0A95_11360 [Micromonospora sp. NPDC049230]|uniref:hypothetical protein n=1 Tax=Micromonospora sp. NPDC049230 TaxID=3155502 RepID=UPI0033C36E52